MSKQVIVPFGPQHPVLPEPIHLDLVLEDEKVVDAIPTIGYVHRGLEKLVEKREFPEYVFIAERICGICSYIHSNTYCDGIEQIMGLEVPERAQYLRTIWSEYSRMHSHLLWLGLFADAMGFESVFMNAWRLREHLLDDMEATTGGRVIQGVCKVGGVRRDIAPEKLDEMLRGLKGLERELRDLLNVFLYDSSIKNRLVGVGKLSSEDAYILGAVGPVARGSGIDIDIRSTG
jgi:Ni,Fe-hydrogenase III large subunit